MNVHKGHRERVKKRFLLESLDNFDPHNVLELMLFYVKPQNDTNELAHALLDRYGSLSGVFDAPYEDLLKVKGVGEHGAILIKLIPQLTSRYMKDKFSQGQTLTSIQKAGEYFVPFFYGKVIEEVHMLCLDDKNKIIKSIKLSEGTVNATPITVRKVITEAINANATAVILAHNHPGGIALPSSADKYMTKKIYQALAIMNIRFLDHVIVADEDYVSMADSGLFESYKTLLLDF